MDKISNSCLAGNIHDTGFAYTLSIINGKYKMIILYCLAISKENIRFNELHRIIGSISDKTLSATLKQLKDDGLIERIEFPQVPPKVEYALSEKGKTLMPILDQMCTWGAENR